jgi:hypothetical protein
MPPPLVEPEFTTTPWPDDPVVLEIDAWVWLDELSGRLSRPVTLGDIPDAAWDTTLPASCDAVWLMGVWERSPFAAKRAWEVWGDEARRLVPGASLREVPGSPYAVRRYAVDGRLGGDAGLAVARRQLARRGVRLMLDHVPNHVAVEHPWLVAFPEIAIEGSRDDLAREPRAFVELDDRVLACGRDPGLAAWSDVVQLNPLSPVYRWLTVDTLRSIADRCDGVRVDMAMLLLDDVARRTWGDHLGPAPATPFWVEVIGAVRATHPEFHLVAEAYWDREPDLIEQGFDRCYDKSLTDELLAGDVAAVRARLATELSDQHRTLRFVENHDEARSLAAFGHRRALASAAVVAMAPGGMLVFDGQLDGRRVRLPVGMGRRPFERPDRQLRHWYERLLTLRAEARREGADFTLLGPTAATVPGGSGPGSDPGSPEVVAWRWSGPLGSTLVAVNLGERPARVVVEFAGGRVRGHDPVDAVDGRRLAVRPAPRGSLGLALEAFEVAIVRGEPVGYEPAIPASGNV